ncbi:hypothetical protein SLA2020_122740 [Shorea laevis]
MAFEKSKILIFGATGYLGTYLVKASISMGHDTYAYTRPLKPNDNNSSKLQRLREFESMGVTLFQENIFFNFPIIHNGELDDHEKLVSVLRQVEVVISAVPIPQYHKQLNIIQAMKDAGTIKRFVPSEYGNEADRVTAFPPFEAILSNKRKIRRATEAAGLSYTFISANSFAVYFVNYLLHPEEKDHQVIIYGSGEAKAVLNYEEDVATYIVRAATDPRAANRLVIIRPLDNVVSQLDLISSWEKKTGRNIKRFHVPEEEIIKQTETLPSPENVPPAILHSIFVKGDQTSFELTEEDLEASELYPEYKHTSVDRLLDVFVVNPPSKPKLASFGT